MRQQFDGFRQAFPDFRATILDQVAEGDNVVTCKVFHGTHLGDLMGIPPTGREIDPRDGHRPRGRRADRRALGMVDRLGLLQQLEGTLPQQVART